MPINLNLNIFKSGGEPHTVKIFEFRDGDAVSIPDGSTILYVEFIENGDYLEVWAAVPNNSIISSTQEVVEDTHVPHYKGPQILRQNDVDGLPTPEEVPVKDLVVEEMEDGDEVIFLDYGNYGIDEQNR